MAPFVDDYDSAGLSYGGLPGTRESMTSRQRLAAIAEQGGSDQKGTILEMWSQALPGVPIPEWPRQRPIRLTESWFCCAEPTSGQLLRAGAGAG